MIEAVIHLLIYICVMALVVYLVLWVLEAVGVTLPPMVVKIVWIIATLVILLLFLQIILPATGIRIR